MIKITTVIVGHGFNNNDVRIGAQTTLIMKPELVLGEVRADAKAIALYTPGVEKLVGYLPKVKHGLLFDVLVDKKLYNVDAALLWTLEDDQNKK